jgi:ribosomal protein L16 Arg81 hydroxylase
MGPYRFEDFAGDPEVFFAEYFGRKPLLRRRALAGRLADLPSVRDLDDVLALKAAPPSSLRVTMGGRGLPSSLYTHTAGRGAARSEAVDSNAVYELFRSGATVTWDSLNHILPSARRLLEPFTQAFASETEVLLFMTPAGNDGFSPHCDPIEVFVVQVNGTKSWKLWDTPENDAGQAATHSLEELGKPTLEVTLGPGDVLYVPHGTPHAATAQGALSVHLSVGVQLRRWRDLLSDTMAALLAAEGFGGFAVPTLGHDGSTAFELSRKLELLQDMVTKLDPASEITRLTDVGRRRAEAGGRREFELLSEADAFTAGTLLRRSDRPVEISPDDGGKASLTANGHQLAVPGPVAATLRALESGGTVTAGQVFTGVASARSLRAAQQLARFGVLEATGEADE